MIVAEINNGLGSNLLTSDGYKKNQQRFKIIVINKIHLHK